MGFLNKKILLFLWCCLLAVFLWACGDDDNGESYTLNPQLLLTPPPAYQLRQAAYLDFCYAHNGPGQGGIHGQVCRASRAAGGYDEEKIIQSLSKIDNREDTSDFDLNSILRILFLDRKQPSLPLIPKLLFCPTRLSLHHDR